MRLARDNLRDGVGSDDESDGQPAFFSCGRLVGGGGFVPDTMTSITHLALGEDGVLTNPAADTRDWFYCYQYDDGELVFTASTSPESGARW